MTLSTILIAPTVPARAANSLKDVDSTLCDQCVHYRGETRECGQGVDPAWPCRGLRLTTRSCTLAFGRFDQDRGGREGEGAQMPHVRVLPAWECGRNRAS